MAKVIIKGTAGGLNISNVIHGDWLTHFHASLPVMINANERVACLQTSLIADLRADKNFKALLAARDPYSNRGRGAVDGCGWGRAVRTVSNA